MKSARFVSCFALIAVLALANDVRAAEDPILVPMTKVSSDAAPGMYCNLQLALSPTTQEILGVQYECRGTEEASDFYPIEKIREGVVLFHYDAFNVDVISVAAPNLDVAQGGLVTIHYLSNYLRNDYADWEAEVINNGGKWTAYTSRSNGHRAFNDLFAVKRTVLGQIVGVKEIKDRWVEEFKLW